MPNDADKDFSDRFRARLGTLIKARFGTERGWKTEAERVTGVGRQLGRYLSGEQEPSAGQVARIARGLGCKEADLYDFTAPIPEVVLKGRNGGSRDNLIPPGKHFEVQRSLNCRSNVSVQDIKEWHPDVGREFIREFFRTVREGAERGEVAFPGADPPITQPATDSGDEARADGAVKK